MQDDRYSRQELVPQFAGNGQARLAVANVVMVGAGGLGCYLGPLLVGAGVGSLTIIDHDTISLTNLHRQTLYREAQIGQPKAQVAQATLAALNSNVRVKALNMRCHPGNVKALISGADVVLDAADNFALSYLLSDACAETQTLLISASVNRTYGYVGAFCGAAHLKLPELRGVFPRVPDTLVSCDVVGVTGPSVAAIAAVQAQQTLKFLLTQSISATLWQFELWDYAVHGIDISGADVETQPTPTIGFVIANQINQELVIDVREADEVAIKPLPFSNVLHIPLSQMGTNTDIPNNQDLVFACSSGQRALIAAQRCMGAGREMHVLVPSD
jgi:molybdopterin/thiamine biosynthesis adenylyltransferase